MIGVVADDTTGANDIGVMFAKHGYHTRVLTLTPELGPEALQGDAVVIDTDSRLDHPEVAAEKVRRATRLLMEKGCTVYWKKTCSVFRGNVGPEFDAMLDTLGADFGIAVAAFPKNGRTTVHGMHAVRGVPLAESEFRRDPVHPTTESDLRRVLQNQTPHPVGHVDLDTVRRGAAAIKEALDGLRGRVRYALFDAETQADLAAIAEATAGEKVQLGGSGLAEELPPFWPPVASGAAVKDVDLSDPCGVFAIAGSLMPQTRAQVEAARQAGLPCLELDTVANLTEAGAKSEMERIVSAALPLLRAGRDVVVHSAHRPEQVSATKAAGAALGLPEVEVSRAVSRTLAEITAAVLQATGLKKLVIMGGDTTGTIVRRLGIQGNIVLDEIEPGLPSGLALGVRPLLVVLKSGSFGKPEFLLKAMEHLKEYAN
ncbi:MAG TPA: four-carbon acid sugar kinase family protein [Symbiobacteriaceae bacterium]|jgi:uncharacterized protein YgbK (DUF1537 family)|nr:four-carbon acid sugar kinase family protein [Symbiobacteriaceae bacterium]